MKLMFLLMLPYLMGKVDLYRKMCYNEYTKIFCEVLICITIFMVGKTQMLNR